MSWQVLSSIPDQLGESPFWHPLEQMLYWIDIPGQHIRRMNVFTGEVQNWPMLQEPGCIAPVLDGGLLIALRDGVYLAKHWGGALTPLYAANYDTATTRFNDGKADPLGRFWCGTIFEPRTERSAVLYSFSNSGLTVPTALVARPMATGAVIGNGLAWSPDHRTVYWADTTQHIIWAWDWSAVNNTLSNQRVFHQFALKPEGWQPGSGAKYGGRPDGAAVDVLGNYWVAMMEGARIVKLSPQGILLEEYAVPALCPTMLCFGGDDLQTLYLTTASYKRSESELRQFPASGHVLSMRTDTKGLPVNYFHPQS